MHLRTRFLAALIGLFSTSAGVGQEVPASVLARYGASARPVEMFTTKEAEADAANQVSHGDDLVPFDNGRLLNFDAGPASRAVKTGITEIQAGTPLNRAISQIASLGGLGYTPSPIIKDTLVEVARVAESTPIDMINKLVGPYGYRALIRDNTVEVFGKGIDETLVQSVLTYQLKHVRFGLIADSPRSSLASDTSGAMGAMGGMGYGGGSGGPTTPGGGGAAGSQVLAPLDLEADAVNSFFSRIGAVVLSGKGTAGKPASSIVYDPRSRTITARDLPPYLEMLRQWLVDFDRPQRKVAVHMRILSVTHTPTRHQGIDPSGFLGAVDATVGQLNGADRATVANAAGGVLSTLIGPVVFPGFNSPGRSNLALGIPELNATLHLLRRFADVELVQETFLVAQDGMPVHKFVGRKLFIVVPGTQAAGVGIASPPLTFQPLVGDTVTFRPEVGEDGEITASFKLESSLEDEKSNYAGQLYPQYAVNETQQYLTARDGQTVMLSGYLKDQIQANRTEVPILGDLPIIGPRLFGASQTTRSRSITLFLLTMQIIEPGNRDAEEQLSRKTIQHLRKDPVEVDSYIFPEKDLRESITGLDQAPDQRSPKKGKKSVEDVRRSPLNQPLAPSQPPNAASKSVPIPAESGNSPQSVWLLRTNG